ncbi:MAG: ABC transporter ATP-binding protein [Muribaculaceae bacterium]|nr:ABC transporter ATP-binding protein [Muribaculaceae bacterium]
MKPILQTRQLAIGYKGAPLLKGIDLSLFSGITTAVIGRNGSGKSTLIKTLTASLKPKEGEVILDGKPLGSYSNKELARLMAFVGTEKDIAGGLRLHELVALGRIPHTGFFGKMSQEDRRGVEHSIELVGISHKADAFVGELSDGERQKAMIAKGLAQNTPIIIMDEPFTFLDIASKLEMLRLLNRIAESEKKAILFSTHEISLALRMAPRGWLFTSDMQSGEKRVVDGTPDQMIERGEIDKVFPDSAVKFSRETGEFILENAPHEDSGNKNLS